MKFKNIKETNNIYEAKPGDANAVNGYIATDIQKDQVYSICFESLDYNEKQVSFDYSQTKRQKHFTKG